MMINLSANSAKFYNVCIHEFELLNNLKQAGPVPREELFIDYRAVSVPFLLAAQLVGGVLVSIFNQIELTGENVHSIPDKQVLQAELLVPGPPQKYALVFNVKLEINNSSLFQ